MSLRRPVAAALLLLLIAATAFGAAQLIVREDPFNPSDPAASVPELTTGPAVGRGTASYLDQTVALEAADAAFVEAHQHKVWFARDAWHAAMPTGPRGEIQIGRLDWSTQRWHETPTAIDERPEARVDVLAEGDLLYVAAAGAFDTDPLPLTFGVWELDEAGDTYVRQPDMPVMVADVDAEAASLVRGGDGALWMLALVDGRMRLWRAAEDVHAWNAVTPPGDEGASIDTAMLLPTEEAAAVAYIEAGENQIAYAAASEAGWADERVDVAGLAPGVDQLDGIVHDGITYIVTRPSIREAGDVDPLDPEIQLVRRTADGAWSSHLVTRITDRRVSPVIAVDPDTGTIYIITSSGRAPALLTYKAALLDTLQFATGIGEPIVEGDDTINLGEISAPRSTLATGGGLVLVTADEASGQLMHAVLAPAGATLADQGREPTDDATERAIGGLALVDTFQAAAAAGPMPAVWELRLDQAAGSAGIVDLGAGVHVARLVSGPEDTRTRACREWTPTTQPITVSAEFRIPRPGPRPATIAVGGAGGDVATALFEEDGELRVVDGATEVRTGAFYRARVWYRSTFEVDPAARTFTWRLEERDTGTVILELKDLAWPEGPEGAVQDVCFRAPAAVVDASLDFDNVTVTIGAAAGP